MGWIKTYSINILTVIFSLFMAVVLAEFVLRILFVPIPKHYHYSADVIKNDPLRGYKLVPNKTTIMSNGFFEEQIIVDKNGNRDIYSQPFGDSGIVAIGDSQTFGHGINAEDSWPEILQQKISKNIINTGVFGYSPHQYFPTIDEHIANGLNIKTVLYALTYNDIFGGAPELKFFDGVNEKLGSPIKRSATIRS